MRGVDGKGVKPGRQRGAQSLIRSNDPYARFLAHTRNSLVVHTAPIPCEAFRQAGLRVAPVLHGSHDRVAPDTDACLFPHRAVVTIRRSSCLPLSLQAETFMQLETKIFGGLKSVLKESESVRTLFALTLLAFTLTT